MKYSTWQRLAFLGGSLGLTVVAVGIMRPMAWYDYSLFVVIPMASRWSYKAVWGEE